MKRLYEFSVNRLEKVDEVETSVNEQGQEVKIVKKVDKKVPCKFYIRKPNRVMFDDAELFYSVQLSQFIKDGLLTRAQLATKFADEASTISEEEKKKYSNNVLKLVDLENDYQKIVTSKGTADLTEEEKKRVEEILNEIVRIRGELQELENQQSNLFEFTAENRARNRTILWWVLHLSYDDSGKPIYGEGSYKDRLAIYDKYEEEDNEFILEVTKRFLVLVSFWFVGRAEQKEDFDRFLEASFPKE